MDGTDPYSYAAQPKRPRLTPILLALLLAFVLGILLAGAALRRWPTLARTLLPGIATPAPLVSPPVTASAPIVAPEPAQPDSALVGKVEALSDRVEQVDQRATQASGDADRAEGMLVAFAARRALDRGQPLGFLEGMLRQRFAAQDATSVATVIAAAQRPVTMAMLQDRLASIAPTLKQASPGVSWWTGFRREVGSLFVVRRADAASPLPADRLVRAGHALDSGQADVALAEIARLPASAAQADWIALARRYVLARTALDHIETAALLTPAPRPADGAG